MIKLSKTVTRSAKDYVDALIEACGKAGGVDPIDVLIDTAAHPKVTREIDMAEFIVGWFHGVAECHDIEVDNRKAMSALWLQIADGKVPVAAAPKPKPARKAKPEVHRAHPPKRAPQPVPPVVPPAPPEPKVTHPTCQPCSEERGSDVAHAPPYCTPTAPTATRTRRKRIPAAQTALLMDPTPSPGQIVVVGVGSPAVQAAAQAKLDSMRKQRGPRPTRNG